MQLIRRSEKSVMKESLRPHHRDREGSLSGRLLSWQPAILLSSFLRLRPKPASRSSSFASEETWWLSTWRDHAAASYACRFLARAIGGAAEEVR